MSEPLVEASRADDLLPVRVKSIEQQALQALHRSRSAWMATRTARINTLRGFCREFGIAISQGSRLQLSAELGTMVLGAGECNTAGCTTVSGLRLGSESGGMRFNPYVSFGASYRY